MVPRWLTLRNPQPRRRSHWEISSVSLPAEEVDPGTPSRSEHIEAEKADTGPGRPIKQERKACPGETDHAP